ncbi:hypothetical protein N431DRAFT_433611 [Stipitochalara longipes BDJ]|nr:hypothetical protein N431DRAFT_433611 [Stipitochalara longipes BDJ]
MQLRSSTQEIDSQNHTAQSPPHFKLKPNKDLIYYIICKKNAKLPRHTLALFASSYAHVPARLLVSQARKNSQAAWAGKFCTA